MKRKFTYSMTIIAASFALFSFNAKAAIPMSITFHDHQTGWNYLALCQGTSPNGSDDERKNREASFLSERADAQCLSGHATLIELLSFHDECIGAPPTGHYDSDISGSFLCNE